MSFIQKRESTSTCGKNKCLYNYYRINFSNFKSYKMKALEQLERLKRINKQIKDECTGTPNEFSSLLGISRRQLYSDIEYIKDIGVEVMYSKARRTFYYCSGQELEISYSLKVISKELTKGISGGFFDKYFPCAFLMHGTNLF